MTYHMRRKDKEISDLNEIKKILKRAQFVTLALSMNDKPYIVSLSHGYDENSNCLYFHCAKSGKKLEYMKSNDAVWGQALIDYGYSSGECTHLYASVHFSGKISFLEDPIDKRKALELMMRSLDKNPESLISELTAERIEKVAIGRLDIDYMSGKKSKEIVL